MDESRCILLKLSAKCNLSSLAVHPRLARATVEIKLTICEVMLRSRGCVAIVAYTHRAKWCACVKRVCVIQTGLPLTHESCDVGGPAVWSGYSPLHLSVRAPVYLPADASVRAHVAYTVMQSVKSNNSIFPLFLPEYFECSEYNIVKNHVKILIPLCNKTFNNLLASYLLI